MRIVLVADQLSREGGAEAFVTGYAVGLHARGHEVRLCVSRVSPDAPPLPAGIQLTIAPFAGEGEPGDRVAAAAIADGLSRFSPDVVHMHNVFDCELFDAIRERWPLVWHCHDYRTNCPNGDRRLPHWGAPCKLAMGAACLFNSVVSGCVAGPRPKTLRELSVRRRLFASVLRADRIATPSRCVSRILETNGADSGRITVVPSYTAYAELPVAPAYPSSPALCFAARLVPQKGTDDMLWLARALHDDRIEARIIVAGGGPELDRFEAAAKTQPSLDVRGKLGAGELSAAYAEASAVLVLPNWLDPFPTVGLEAMAHARPVIAFDVGGIGELVETGVDGVLVGGRDRTALLAAVKGILRDPARAKEMGNRARIKVLSTYRLENSLKASLAAYEDARRSHGVSG